MSDNVEFEIDVPDLALYEARGVEVMSKIIIGAINEAGALIWERAVANAPVGATGNLRNTIKDRPIFFPLGVAVSPFADYAEGVEKGTSPHVVPTGDLAVWAKRKFALSDQDALQVATVVRRNIAQFGTEGQFFMKKTFDESEAQVRRMFDGAGRKAIRELRKP